MKNIKAENIAYVNVHVDDSKRCRAENERKVYSFSQRNMKEKYRNFLCMDLYGEGVERLLRKIGEEEFEELLDIVPIGQHNVRRYGCCEDNLTELIDNMPLYSAVKIGIGVEDDDFINEYYFLLVKEAQESSLQPHIFRLAKFLVGGEEV